MITIPPKRSYDDSSYSMIVRGVHSRRGYRTQMYRAKDRLYKPDAFEA